MNVIDTNTLDDKKKVKAVKTETIEVIPNFITGLLTTMFLLNVALGSLLYFNRGVILENWRYQVHNWTKPQTANAETAKPTVSPTAKPSASPTVVIVPTNKGGCDTRYNELHEGVCYPKALE